MIIRINEQMTTLDELYNTNDYLAIEYANKIENIIDMMSEEHLREYKHGEIYINMQPFEWRYRDKDLVPMPGIERLAELKKQYS